MAAVEARAAVVTAVATEVRAAVATAAVVRVAASVAATGPVTAVAKVVVTAALMEVERGVAAKVPPGTAARAEARVPWAAGRVAAKAAMLAVAAWAAAGRAAARQ
jgi:hypothetical protein